MAEEKKKSGLQKDISSIFAGLEDIDNGREDQPAAGREPVSPPAEEPLPRSAAGDQSDKPPPPISPLAPNVARLISGGDFPNRRNAFIGLDVGSSSIKMVQLYPVVGGWEVGGYAVQEFQAGAGGKNLFENEFFARRLKELFAETGASRNGVICSLRGDQVSTGLIQLARMPKSELESACRLETGRRVTFTIDRALIQQSAVEKETDRPGGKLNYIVTAATRETVSRVLSVLQQAGLQIAALLPLPFAWKDFLRSALECDETAAAAIVDVGSSYTLVSIYKGSQLYFSREFDTGGRQITEAVIQAGKTFRTINNLSWEEAEEIKKTRDLFQAAGAQSLKDNLTILQVGGMVRPVVEKIVQESKRSLDYYHQLYRKEEVGRIFLCGGGALMPGFARFFQERLRPPVEVLGLRERIRLHGSIASEQEIRDLFPRLARAAALSASRRWEINFIPPLDKILQKILRRKILIIIPVAALFVTSYIFYRSKTALIPRQEQVVALKQKQLNGMKEDLAPYNVLAGLQKQLNAREQVGLSSSLRQPNWRGILKEFSRITPPSMVISGIMTVKDAVPQRILCSGRVLDPESSLHSGVTQFIVQVENSIFFKEVQKISEDIERGTFSFSCTLVY
ncbi:MAG: type IV pilus assembly protein PilM [PVC group bacterium]